MISTLCTNYIYELIDRLMGRQMDKWKIDKYVDEQLD